MMGGEMVRQTLELLCTNWDKTPVRVVQDGRWSNLYLSEIRAQDVVAEQVIRFLIQRHLPGMILIREPS